MEGKTVLKGRHSPGRGLDSRVVVFTFHKKSLVALGGQFDENSGC
jgi:hypothetical protein